MIRYTVHFTGHVQGVGFRYTTREIAANHPVTGYVQNLTDGRVLLVAEGQDADLQALLQEILERMGRYIRTHTLDKSPASGEFGQPGDDPLSIRH